MPLKVVVIGSPEGSFTQAFDKLSKLHAKNTFSLAIIVGDLFANPPNATSEDDENITKLLNGDITVPITTYFALGRHSLPAKVTEKLESSDDEVCPNLYFLGKRSSFKTAEGLRIAILGGHLDSALTGVSKDKYLPFHTEDDAKALRDAKGAEVLITSQWPTMIRSRSKVQLPDNIQAPETEQCAAELCSELKPRYHFSISDGLFYEREPFFHLTEDGKPDPTAITRFISLAPFNNVSKQKWLYAFTIDPNAPPSTVITPGTTVLPFTSLSPSIKRERDDDQSQSYSRFANGGGDHYRPTKNMRGPRGQRGYRPPPTPLECFFCLSNPNLATHLITSIGTDVYLTIAKGPLPTAKTFPNLGCPSHILIIPLPHSPTFKSIEDPEVRSSTYKEMQRYRRALHSLLIDKGKDSLGAVTFEISRGDGVHVHWQLLPVPADLIKKGLVEAAFKVEAENQNYPIPKVKEIGDGSTENSDYFRVWIWRPEEGENGADAANGHSDEDDERETRGKEKSMALSFPSDLRFDLQFGRRVIAKLLGLGQRAHWRDCAQTEDEEKKDAEAFKAAFKKFDFSLED